MTNDDARTVTRYSFDPVTGFVFEDAADTTVLSGAADPEGITSDPATGTLYVADGNFEWIVVYTYDEGGAGFVLVDIFDLQEINPAAEAADDPEGIAFDVNTGHLFMVSDQDDGVFEYTTEGVFVDFHNLTLLVPSIVGEQGLAFAPTSNPDDNPLTQALYVADAMIDNGVDPTERDGQVFEALIGPDRCGNGVFDPGEDCGNCPADVP